MTQDDLMDRTNLALLDEPQPVVTDDLWGDLLDGGYIRPEGQLEPGDAMRVRNAMRLLKEYERLLTNSGVLEYC